MLTHTHTHTQIKKNQQKIEMILESKKIPFNKLDMAADETLKAKMREIAGDPKALPPQLANGDQYCGVSFYGCCIYWFVSRPSLPAVQYYYT